MLTLQQTIENLTEREYTRDIYLAREMIICRFGTIFVPNRRCTTNNLSTHFKQYIQPFLLIQHSANCVIRHNIFVHLFII